MQYPEFGLGLHVTAGVFLEDNQRALATSP